MLEFLIQTWSPLSKASHLPLLCENPSPWQQGLVSWCSTQVVPGCPEARDIHGNGAAQRYKPAKLVLTVHSILGFREIKGRVGWDPGQTWGEGRQLEQGEPGQRSLSSTQQACCRKTEWCRPHQAADECPGSRTQGLLDKGHSPSLISGPFSVLIAASMVSYMLRMCSATELCPKSSTCMSAGSSWDVWPF